MAGDIDANLVSVGVVIGLFWLVALERALSSRSGGGLRASRRWIAILAPLGNRLSLVDRLS